MNTKNAIDLIDKDQSYVLEDQRRDHRLQLLKKDSTYEIHYDTYQEQTKKDKKDDPTGEKYNPDNTRIFQYCLFETRKSLETWLTNNNKEFNRNCGGKKISWIISDIKYSPIS